MLSSSRSPFAFKQASRMIIDFFRLFELLSSPRAVSIMQVMPFIALSCRDSLSWETNREIFNMASDNCLRVSCCTPAAAACLLIVCENSKHATRLRWSERRTTRRGESVSLRVMIRSIRLVLLTRLNMSSKRKI